MIQINLNLTQKMKFYLLGVSVSNHSWSYPVSCIIGHHVSPPVLDTHRQTHVNISFYHYIIPNYVLNVHGYKNIREFVSITTVQDHDMTSIL